MVNEIISSGTALQNKWGNVLNEGFQVIPNRLLKSQSELKLSNTHMVVLLNLLMHWWVAGRRPYPQNHMIAERMGVDVRNVQRALKEMEGLKILQRVRDDDGNKSYDLSRLVERLNDKTTPSHYPLSSL